MNFTATVLMRTMTSNGPIGEHVIGCIAEKITLGNGQAKWPAVLHGIRGNIQQYRIRRKFIDTVILLTPQVPSAATIGTTNLEL